MSSKVAGNGDWILPEPIFVRCVWQDWERQGYRAGVQQYGHSSRGSLGWQFSCTTMKVRTLACAISDVKRIIEFKGLIVRGNNHSDCAHSCRYCPIGRKRSIITLEHYE